jgi:VIT1/CCC1 family predicted Fe2+/Mn2+ transporter
MRMATQDDIRRYRRNLFDELEAKTLYQCLASVEPNPEISGVYRALAETESSHAAAWARRLQEAGEEVPRFKPGWRTRVLCWMARRYGPASVLHTIAGIEQRAKAHYRGQPEPEASQMSRDEEAHANVFSQLAGAGPGLEGSAVAKFEGRHHARRGNVLRAGVLGANDGLVSVFSLVMGVAGAGVGSGEILLTGFAGLLAGALSMALGEWLSVQSSRELYQHQLGIEKRELEENPEEELEELTLIYQAKGVPPDSAREMAGRILSDHDTALDTMAREELGIDPEELGGSAWVAALTSFLLFALGAIIPVAPYFFFTGNAGILASCLASTAGLFAIGAAITLLTGRSALFSGLRQVAFGLAAAAVTFGVGHLIGVSLG